MSGSLQDHHRMFIQIMMGKKICTTEEVKRLHRVCHERNNTQPGDLKIFVDKINAAINLHNLAIKKGKDEISGEEYYVLINTVDNELSKLNSLYKQKDLELFKRIIIGIVESEDGKVSSSTILNKADEVSMSKKDANDAILRFKKDGWLLEQEGSLYLSTRAIVELQHFLTSHYGELVSRCSICKNVVLQGVNCATCDTKIHYHCKENYFTKVEVNNKCPECNENFE